MSVQPASGATREFFHSSAPPRAVPSEVLARVLPKGPFLKKVVILGLVLIFGLVFSFIFVPRHPFEGLRLAEGSVETIKGEILEMDRTNSKVNGSRVWKYKFVYRLPDNREQRGISYVTGKRWEVGSWVDVQYLTADPTKAVMVGGRLDVFPAWAAATIVLPIVAICSLFVIFRGRTLDRRILKDGAIGQATVDSVGNALATVNGRQLHKIRLDLDGMKIVKRTLQEEEIDLAKRRWKAREPVEVLYLPAVRNRFFLPEVWDE